MRSLVVVMQAVFAQDRLEVSLVDDKHPIEALSATTSNPALTCAFASAHEWVRITRAPSDLNTASDWGANFLSRSWITTLNLMPSSSSFQLVLRACWVIQASDGWAVQLAATTLRVARGT
ncbi:MAG: hypothetical protein M3082_05615 [Candidatus Dormibacteraeota bacterium]|nr:hypothetical protein [Candidatus Dormibacteraeota bacterium]